MHSNHANSLTMSDGCAQCATKCDTITLTCTRIMIGTRFNFNVEFYPAAFVS